MAEAKVHLPFKGNSLGTPPNGGVSYHSTNSLKSPAVGNFKNGNGTISG